MFVLLLRLMVIAVVVECGLSLRDVRRVERASRDILRVEWKAISMFPEEARRFR